MRTVLVLLFALLSVSVYCQQFTISGTVRSADGSSPLAGATIYIVGTAISATTDNEGNFTLQSAPNKGAIRVAYIGYKKKELAFDINEQSQITIQLSRVQNAIDDIQVIGYGETTKRFNTGSVVSISAKQIEQQPVTNVLSALSGRMAGVFVQTTNGLPGCNINIQIRGTGSIQAGTNPLYIIDGVPYDGEALNQGTSLASSSIVGTVSPLNILNPNDIEDISVLKDADATAIYGSRGSNGVVLITTKKGKSGGTRVNFSINQGFSKLTNFPNLLNLEQYLEMRRQAFANASSRILPTNWNPAPHTASMKDFLVNHASATTIREISESLSLWPVKQSAYIPHSDFPGWLPVRGWVASRWKPVWLSTSMAAMPSSSRPRLVRAACPDQK